jgi:hypothetical protein
MILHENLQCRDAVDALVNRVRHESVPLGLHVGQEAEETVVLRLGLVRVAVGHYPEVSGSRF